MKNQKYRQPKKSAIQKYKNTLISGWKQKLFLFILGFTQLILISISTWMIAKEKTYGVFITEFIMAFAFSLGIKEIVQSNMLERTIYALGSGLGALIGLQLMKLLF